MDRTIVPTNLLSWPRVKNLIPDHKLIVLALWQNTFITPCGAYFIDLDMFSGMLGFNKVNVDQAINDFVEKGIIEFDFETSEVLICDWWRFHKCESPAQINMTQKAVDKIQSDRLKTEFFERIKAVSSKIKDLRSNNNITQHNLTKPQQQPAAEAADVCSGGFDLVFHQSFNEKDRSAVSQLIPAFKKENIQLALDEYIKQLTRPGAPPIIHKAKWIKALVEKGVQVTPELKTRGGDFYVAETVQRNFDAFDRHKQNQKK